MSDEATSYITALGRCLDALVRNPAVEWARCASNPGLAMAALGDEFFEFSLLGVDGPIARTDQPAHAMEVRIRNSTTLIPGPPAEMQPELWRVLQSLAPDDDAYHALRRRMFRVVMDVLDATTRTAGA